MVWVRKIAVQHIRSHDQFSIDLAPQTTAIIGKNGTGKTTLLEALYIAFQGTSFKGADKDVLRHDTPWWRIDVALDDDQIRTVTYDPSKATGKKQFTVDGAVSYRLNPKHKYPIVLFEPDDLRLLHGSPARRRLFIDRFISQLNPLYANALRKYERALRQRNNLLKHALASQDELFAWNVTLSEYGAYIIEQRIMFIEKLQSQLPEAYNSISDTRDDVSIHYSHTTIDYSKQKMLRDLEQQFERDKLLGYTSIGPHRHDVVFGFNNNLALSVASRGEIRSIVLALKFLEVDIIESITDVRPLILLDDVFSELDEDRQKRLMASDSQVVLTSTAIPYGVDIKAVRSLDM